MKCCDEKQDKKIDSEAGVNHKMKKHMPHMLMMLLCCGLPFALILTVPLIISSNPTLGAKILPVIPFICPILMAGMMFMMFRNEKKDSQKKNETDNAETKWQ